MDNQILKSKFVIMVCTAAYSRALTGNEEPGKRRGVTWEAKLIDQKKYYKDKYPGHKFIPVFFGEDNEGYIPPRFSGETMFLMKMRSKGSAPASAGA